MIKIDLITGFLGAGKTTFLKRYARYFMNQGKKIGILENDYGAVNVDMLLLGELRSENCELEMVAGGCCEDCHRRRFKTKLISMAMSGYDRVLVEPSGIFDMDEFFDALREDPLERWYEIGNVIAIVDARLEEGLSQEAEFYLASQLANAGCIVLSRTQLVTEEKIVSVTEHLQRACEKVQLRHAVSDRIIRKDWEALNDSDLQQIAECGYQMGSYVKLVAGRQNDFSTVYFLKLPITREKLVEEIPHLMTEERFGKILRLKGFLKDADAWLEVNATARETDIREIPIAQEVLILIGEELNEKEIRRELSEAAGGSGLLAGREGYPEDCRGSDSEQNI